MFKQLIKLLLNNSFYRTVFEDRFENWEEVVKNSKGYSDPIIVKKTISAFEKIQKLNDAYERDSVIIKNTEYNWPLISTLFYYKLKFTGKIKILDFGGSLASAYFQNKKIIDFLDLDWLIVEQRHFVEYARKKISDKKLKFYLNLQECFIDNKPNFIYIGSSLQYIQEPYQLLKLITNNDAKILFIDRIPVNTTQKDYICKQIVPKSIYNSNYPCWIFSENNFKVYLGINWRLISQFDAIGGKNKTTSGLQFKWKSFIFEKLD